MTTHNPGGFNWASWLATHYRWRDWRRAREAKARGNLPRLYQDYAADLFHRELATWLGFEPPVRPKDVPHNFIPGTRGIPKP